MVIIGEKSTFLASWSPCSPDYAYRWHWKKGVKNGRETCCHASFASSKSLPWIACKVWDGWITVSNHCGRLEEWKFSTSVLDCDRWDENKVVVYLRGIDQFKYCFFEVVDYQIICHDSPFHMCHQGIGGPYRYCEPVKCSWKYCVFYVFFLWCFTFLVFCICCD